MERRDVSLETSTVRFVIVGNPENRRVSLFQDAVAQRGYESHVIPWFDLLSNRCRLTDSLMPGDLVRIDSPGEDIDVERALLKRGSRITGKPLLFSGEHGRIEDLHLWYSGFLDALRQIQKAAATVSTARWMNHPDDIGLMFDKSESQRLLHSRDIPVPQILGTPGSYSELRDLLAASGVSRVFLKLRHGSSASGVIALQTNRNQMIAMSSAELVEQPEGPAIYNSLNVRRYTCEREVAALVDTLGKMGLHVERWIPKAGVDNRVFDLRVMVIAGTARHTVMRTSRSPMTNLHLGNERGDIEQLRKSIPQTVWESAMESCERAAACFPRSLYCGVDLIFTPGYRRHYVVEVNAFGDLLPGVLSKLQSTYEAEVGAVVGPSEQ